MARISAKALVNFQNVNSYQYANQWQVRAGDTSTLYLQLVDLDQGAYNSIGGLVYGAPASTLSGNAGLRYIAGIGTTNTPVTLIVSFPSIDPNKAIALTAVQDMYDGSIFSITVPSEKIPSGGNVVFKLTEGGASKAFSVLNMMAVEFPESDGSDGTLLNSDC